MAFGDSITQGDGSRGRRGYRDELHEPCSPSASDAPRSSNEGVTGTDSDRGLERLPDSLARQRPAFTLIHYGTNDWNGFGCRIGLRNGGEPAPHGPGRAAPLEPARGRDPHPRQPRLRGSRWPRRATPGSVATNVEIRAMAAAEAWRWPTFTRPSSARTETLEPLFSDHVHPNDRGYSVMAAEFFRALTAPRSR